MPKGLYEKLISQDFLILEIERREGLVCRVRLTSKLACQTYVMEFSELFHGCNCTFSPSGRFIACICGDFVEIRYSDTLLKVFKLECGGVVKSALWSCDSVLLICHVGVSTLKIFSIRDGTCVACLKQATGNLRDIRWAADGRTVLYVEPLLFRVAVWKVCDQYGQLCLDYIDNVQPWAKPNFALSANGKHLAVVSCGVMNSSESSNLNESRTSKADDISIFSAISWRIEKSIACNGIQRVGGLVWSPNSNFVVTWPHDPSDPVLTICVRSGTIVNSWKASDKLWPGVCGVDISPSSQFMTVTSVNSKVYIINCVAWCEELELVHGASILDPKCVVYKQALGNELDNPLFVEVTDRPVSISFLSSLGKTRTKSSIAWSSGGRYLASCIKLAPAVIWIWSTAYSFTLCCVIVTKHPVQDFRWDPVRNVLAVVDGQDCVVLWNADEANLSCSSTCTPVTKMLFQANHLNWRYDGKMLVTSSEQNSSVLEVP